MKLFKRSPYQLLQQTASFSPLLHVAAVLYSCWPW